MSIITLSYGSKGIGYSATLRFILVKDVLAYIGDFYFRDKQNIPYFALGTAILFLHLFIYYHMALHVTVQRPLTSKFLGTQVACNRVLGPEVWTGFTSNLACQIR